MPIRISASVTFMFRELELTRRFPAARAAGFDGVEIQYLAEGRPEEMARAARDAGVEVVLVNAGAGDFAQGGLGLSGVPGREAVFREELAVAIEAAAMLGASYVNVGLSRVPDGMTTAECLTTLCSNVEAAVSTAADRGITLLLEPLNRIDVPTVSLGDLEAAAALIDGALRGRVGLLFDVYHVVMTGDDASAAFARHRKRIRHIQFSDVPGRREPGTGTIAFPSFLETVAASYTGWLGAEYHPSSATSETTGWMPSFRAVLATPPRL